MNLLGSELDTLAVLPLVMLVGPAMVLLVLDLFNVKFSHLIWSIAVCYFAWACSWPYLGKQGLAMEQLVYVDAFSLVFNTIILAGAAGTFLLSDSTLEGQRVKPSFDIYMLLLLACAGAMVMVCAANLIVMFIGFELLSISVYVLTGIAKREKSSSEGALKYFILGAFGSAFLLYGMTLVFGATGSMGLTEIARAVSADNTMLLIGLGLIVFGFGFKVSLVPFHFWTPDVYQGAPVSITAFMAVVVKAAAFGCFLRIMHVAFVNIGEAWIGLLWVLSVLSMTIGNLVALRQKSVKRMLAYSSIAHAGYALMGFIAMGESGGGEAVIFYMVAYGLMTLGAFGVVLLATTGTEKQYSKDDLDSLRGLGWSHPFLALAMVLFMLSLAGMPPLAGFIGKVYLFSAAVRAGFVGLAIIGALNSVVSLYYYLGVVMEMYFKGEREKDAEPLAQIGFAPGLALSLSAIGTVYLGLFSSACYDVAKQAINSLSLIVF